MADPSAMPRARPRLPPALNALLALVLCLGTGWLVRQAVLARQLSALGHEARQHGEFYRRSLDSLLSRNESLPKLIAMEDRLGALLHAPAQAGLRDEVNHYLLNVKSGADINAAYLMDRQGLTLASSNFESPGSFVGHNYGYRPYFQEALKGRLGSFFGVGATTGEPGFFMAAPIRSQGQVLGAIVVKISLENFESALVKSGDPVLLVDAHGVVFLASILEWKYRFLQPLEPGALQQIGLSRQYDNQFLQPLDAKLALSDEPRALRLALPGTPEQEYIAQATKAGTMGWSIVLLSRTGAQRQNALLAGVAAGFSVALLLSMLVYYRLNVRRYAERRQADAQLRQAHKELELRIAQRTSELQATNAALQEKVSALKTTESILHETRDSAVQAGKLAVLGQMAAGISHEVNQPLTAIHAFTDNALQFLDRGRLDEVRDNLGDIRQMAARMGHIVSEVKTFARKPPLERQAVSLLEVVSQSIVMVESRRRQLAAQISVQALPAEWRVLADVQRLEQVLVNLLLNALDAVAEAPARRVCISGRRAQGQTRLAIEDSGPGIRADVLPHLFEPFFTTKASGQGLGLGLAISRMIVAELGGRIEAGNLEAGGAAFVLVLEDA